MASTALVVKVLRSLKGAGLQIKNRWRDLKSARIIQKVFAVKNRQKFPKQEVKTFTNCDTCQWDAIKNGVKLLVWAVNLFKSVKDFKKNLYPFRSPVLGNIAKSTGCFPSTCYFAHSSTQSNLTAAQHNCSPLLAELRHVFFLMALGGINKYVSVPLLE